MMVDQVQQILEQVAVLLLLFNGYQVERVEFFFFFFVGAPKSIFYFIATVSGCDCGNRTRNIAVNTWRLKPLSYSRHPERVEWVEWVEQVERVRGRTGSKYLNTVQDQNCSFLF